MSDDTDPVQPSIIVGVDGSDESKSALRWAASLAAGMGARIDAVAAWQFPPAAEWNFAAAGWDPEQDATQWLNKAVDEVFGPDRPDGLQLRVQQGNAAQVLLAESEDAAMLVLGSRGYGGFTGLLLGSVSAKCAEHAHCPVLIVHGDEPPATFTAART